MTGAATEQLERVVKLLEESQGDLERSLEGLGDEFCSAKPATDGWSITEVVEHLAIMEERVPHMLQTRLPALDPAPGNSHWHGKDVELVQQVQSAAKTFDAPEVVKPTGRYRSCREALASLNAFRQGTLVYAKSAPPYLQGRLMPHPVLGPLDGRQWLLILGAHMQRHVKQIEAIKAAMYR